MADSPVPEGGVVDWFDEAQCFFRPLVDYRVAPILVFFVENDFVFTGKGKPRFTQFSRMAICSSESLPFGGI